MPILLRRQLQMMLDELGRERLEGKIKDLLSRLESPDPEQALPAEYELALSWAMAKVTTIEIDRPISSGNPDLFCASFFEAGPAYIDVVAVSDESLSGKKLMRKAAEKMNEYCRSIIKDAPDHLHYEFGEESGYLPANRLSGGFTRYFRKRRITEKFSLTPVIKHQLSAWLRDMPPKAPLRIANEETDVVIAWRTKVHPRANVFSSMPPLAYDVRKNPVYGGLDRKADQLKGAPKGFLKGIFLGDAGCGLLRDIRSKWSHHNFSGEDIIYQFLRDNKHVDFISAFVPRQQHQFQPFGLPNPYSWCVYNYQRENKLTREDAERIEHVRRVLPTPTIHAYTARQLHEQGRFRPQARGHYVNMQWTPRNFDMTIKTSARAVQEILAGRANRDLFKMGDINPFERSLASGMTITSVKIEPAGTTEDDDYIVFELGMDPSARRLRAPKD